MKVYSKDEWKDRHLFKAALEEFRIKHGNEAYKTHVLKSNYERTGHFSSCIGTSRLVSTQAFAAPYHDMVRSIRLYRKEVAIIIDPLISPVREERCLKQSKSAYDRWSLGWRGRVKLACTTPTTPPGKHKDCNAISPARLNMVRDVGDVVDSNFILDLRGREMRGEHVTADVITLVNKRTVGGYDQEELRGCIAWLPDAVKESVALGKTRGLAVRTSKSRMVRFIDKRLKGVSP